MIAVEKLGNNFMGALRYNIKKMNHPDPKQRAELLATSFLSLNPAMIKKEVDLIRELRPALGKYVWHTSLNFSNEERPERLTNDRMLEMALDYMKSMGYDDNQYLIVRHHDADHHHVHLLANRIRYDGSVVSDSNNYRKSQATLRRLEKQFSLVPLEQHYHISKKQSNSISSDRYNDVSVQRHNTVSVEQNNPVTNGVPRLASQRSLTKNEIEKAIRTNQPSDKSLLQALLNQVLAKPGLSLQGFIQECEKNNICLLFNQASTGKVSGITYFINDFKIKGQALGNRFKWAELIKNIDYEQDRDSQAISQANDRTRGRYGTYTAGQHTPAGGQGRSGTGVVHDDLTGGSPEFGAADQGDRRIEADGADHAGAASAGQQDAEPNTDFTDSPDHTYIPLTGIQISDDEDDAKWKRRKRKR